MRSKASALDGAPDDARVGELLTGAALRIDATPHVLRAQPAIAEAWTRATASRRTPGATLAARCTGSQAFRRWLLARPRKRAEALIRPVVAGAFAIVLATGTTAASTTPGAPLYAARLGIERALFPSPGSADRAAAELGYVDRRLAEARQASERGDQRAVAAALGAFTDGLRDLADASVGPEPDELRQHIAQDASALADLRSRSATTATLTALTTAEREVAQLGLPGQHRRPQDQPREGVAADPSRRP